MELIIEGKKIVPKPGQTLLEMIQQLKLDGICLSNRALAAQIAGIEVHLNDVPDTQSIKNAIIENNGVVQLLRYGDAAGKAIYERTGKFILFSALHRLYPEARPKINYRSGSALYMELEGADGFQIEVLKGEIQRLVQSNIVFKHRVVSKEQSIAQLMHMGRADKAGLLRWSRAPVMYEYTAEGYSDYFDDQLLPSTGYLQVWDVQKAGDGFLFIYPDDNNPDTIAKVQHLPQFLYRYKESKRWSEMMCCETVADLNRIVKKGKLPDLIRVSEALHGKNFSQIADQICKRSAKVVMLSGPSASGKTTSALRLATHLRILGKKPIVIGLDDYYIDRELIAPEADGTLDLEHINTIDTSLFRTHLALLMDGREVNLPKFNFLTGKREQNDHPLKLEENTIIIVEGLHALNPALTLQDGQMDMVFRLYVSPVFALNLDAYNKIPSSTLRFLRRIVRDHKTRGTDIIQTALMWESVRKGEVRWIFPYQENADAFLNTSTLYELAVLKKHISPLFSEMKAKNGIRPQIRMAADLLNYIQQADADEEIPPTSLIREFIGGNSYYK